MQIGRVDQVLIAAVVILVVGLGAVGWLFVTESTPSPVSTSDGSGVVVDGGDVALSSPAAGPGTASSSGAPIVVDVEGAVLRPGLYHLVSGARVGDAIAAAGGYDSSVDLDAAALELNLAGLLEDGEKIVVPRLRAPDDGAADSEGDGGEAGDGLVNVNTADAGTLEELPGIGPVTVEKILAAREEEPFASLEEMVERGVLNNGQLDDIRELATAE